MGSRLTVDVLKKLLSAQFARAGEVVSSKPMRNVASDEIYIALPVFQFTPMLGSAPSSLNGSAKLENLGAISVETGGGVPDGVGVGVGTGALTTLAVPVY